VGVITLIDDAALIDHAEPIVDNPRASMVRVSSDFTATPVKGKIADAEEADRACFSMVFCITGT
jgi:hypothetical protein